MGNPIYDRFVVTCPRKASMTGNQRAALLTYLFMKGGEYTTVEVVKLMGYAHRVSALHMLNSLSSVLPLVKGGHGGKWKLNGNTITT